MAFCFALSRFSPSLPSFLSPSLASGISDTAAALQKQGLPPEFTDERTDRTALRDGRSVRANHGKMSIRRDQSKHLFSQKEPPGLGLLRRFKTRPEKRRDRVGCFSPVALETIVLPSSFLPCIPSHNALKSKLPSDKADWSGVRKRRG